jgi:hypothetical protein
MYRQLGNCKYDLEIPPPINVSTPIEIHYEDKKIQNVSSPESWGPAFWFILHLGSVKAPENIPMEKREKYWGFIDGIPEMLACGNCAQHARAYVEAHRPYKDQICATRVNLVEFFTNFHNSVNERNGKPKISCEEIYHKFSGPIQTKFFNYS